MRQYHHTLQLITCGLLVAACCNQSQAAALADGDWPAWRADAARSASTPVALPTDLQPLWTRQLGHPLPAWPASQHKIRFDVSYEPVVAGKRIFVGSMVADSLTAYDTESGRELWRFYTDAPVRFAPVAWNDLVIVVSDDGHAYGIEAASGAQRWTRRCAPKDQLILGNFRLISTWPVRGAPALVEADDGTATIYLAAGIWPFMGTFIMALDPATGDIRWSNSGSGAIYVTQQHFSPAFAGVAPQGYIAVGGDTLFISGGRTVPAAYDRLNGQFKYYQVSLRDFGKDAGGYDVSVIGDRYMNHGCYYDLESGKPLYNLNDGKLLPAGSVARIGADIVSINAKGVQVYHNEPAKVETKVVDRKGKETTASSDKLKLRKSLSTATTAQKAHFAAGNRLYLSGDKGWIGALDMERDEPATGFDWQAKVDNNAWTMIPGDGKLFVVTVDGTLHAFGAATQTARPPLYKVPASKITNNEMIPGPEGYAMIWGLAGKSVAHLTALTANYHVIGIDPDRELIARMRRALDEAGLYGRRIHLLAGDPATMVLPQYLASFMEITLEDDSDCDRLANQAWRTLRPYGGIASFRTPRTAEALTKALVACNQAISASGQNDNSAAATVDADAFEIRLGRLGSIPGAAAWTHENADPGNSVVSRDILVKPPLGLLWFGGPANDDILPRHGHGPAPQVINGRLYIEGPNALRAVDIYTGRLLWQRALPALGKFYDNTAHQPGANEIGSNFASAEDGIYVVYNRSCLRLDPVTGDTLATFTLPPAADGTKPNWGYVGIYKDILVGGAAPLAITVSKGSDTPKVVRDAPYSSSSKQIVAMDRYSGKILWQREASQVFRHNAIALAEDKLFCIDGLSKANIELLRRRGEEPTTPALLLAFDIRSGELLWQHKDDIFGTWLAYSAEHGILIESGSPARDRAKDEAKDRMAAYRASSGELLWFEKFSYVGRPMLRGDTIYTESGACSLLTGKTKMRDNPVTGRPTPWGFKRNYGCNTPIGGQHMLLFRSAAAGFYDLNRDGGTSNWGGFKSGCTANLIPAGGILNAPDYTRTCTCSYQNQCSLALVPMEDVEMWTFQAFKKISGPRQNVAINFGAPGDWPAPDGTLWFEYPIVGGDGPDFNLKIEGAPDYFRHHSTEISGNLKPVAASGLEGNVTITIPLSNSVDRSYDIQLVFADPTATKAGERVFDVIMQGETLLPAFDIVAQAGERRTALVRDFSKIAAGADLTIELRAAGNSPLPPIINGIAAIRRDPARLDFTLNTAIGSSPEPGCFTGTLNISNCYDRAIKAQLTATMADNTLAKSEITLAGLAASALTLNIPARLVNSGDSLNTTLELGADYGRFNVVSEQFEVTAPLPVNVRHATPTINTITVTAKSENTEQTQHPEFTVLLDDVELAKNRLEIAPGKETTFTVATPMSLQGRKARVRTTVVWPANETPLLGKFEEEFDFTALATLTYQETATSTAKPDFVLDADSGVFPESARKKLGHNGDIAAAINWWHDGKAIEIRAIVKDNHHFNTKQKVDIWNGDGLQMAFATTPDNYANVMLALTSTGKELWCYEGNAALINKQSVSAVERTEALKETSYSLTIPFTALGIDPQPGTIFRANFVVFDDDDGNGFKYWRQLTPGLAGGFNTTLYRAFVIGAPKP